MRNLYDDIKNGEHLKYIWLKYRDGYIDALSTSHIANTDCVTEIGNIFNKQIDNMLNERSFEYL